MQKNYVVCLFLDLSREFDSDDRDVLLSKVHAYGFREMLVRWLIVLFLFREQHILCNEKAI